MDSNFTNGNTSTNGKSFLRYLATPTVLSRNSGIKLQVGDAAQTNLDDRA
tara:strand:+ start:1057 stop:1206 length:150 start_codon:yes stop_codon:yes gene_type:complete